MEERAHSRILLKNGTSYAAGENAELLSEAMGAEWIVVQSLVGPEMFPAERLWVRTSEIAAVQEITAEAWAWLKGAAEIHYAKQLRDDAGDIAAAQQAVAEALGRDV